MFIRLMRKYKKCEEYGFPKKYLLRIKDEVSQAMDSDKLTTDERDFLFDLISDALITCN